MQYRGRGRSGWEWRTDNTVGSSEVKRKESITETASVQRRIAWTLSNCCLNGSGEETVMYNKKTRTYWRREVGLGGVKSRLAKTRSNTTGRCGFLLSECLPRRNETTCVFIRHIHFTFYYRYPRIYTCSIRNARRIEISFN